jgi:hypothetical protein
MECVSTFCDLVGLALPARSSRFHGADCTAFMPWSFEKSMRRSRDSRVTLAFRRHGLFVNYLTTGIRRLITVVTVEVRLFQRHAQLSFL